MKPEEPSSSQSGLSLSQQGLVVSNLEKTPERAPQDAAAQIIRSQIDNLYDTQTNVASPDAQTANQSATQLEDINPYQRTHTESSTLQTNDWKHYHTAWQNYYQKYYEGYYQQKASQATNSQNDTSNSRQRSISRNSRSYFNDQNSSQPEAKKTFSTDEAVFDMRQELIGKVRQSATKVRKSRHFIPIISGVFVVLIFVFLQYNRLIVSNVMAYVSPGNIDPQNIVIDPNTDLVVGPEPRLIIPKINVDVPVMYDVGNDYSSQMAAMAKGVAQFAIPGADSHPGQIGNTVIAGHSSNDLLDNGDYKFIFVQLDKLNTGDTIYANYNSKRYTYIVTKKEVVKPTDVSKLVYPTNKPVLTLLTCTPIGTATSRLLVTAEQISPDPSQSVAAKINNNATTTSIPGNSPTFFERLFGAK